MEADDGETAHHICRLIGPTTPRRHSSRGRARPPSAAARDTTCATASLVPACSAAPDRHAGAAGYRERFGLTVCLYVVDGLFFTCLFETNFPVLADLLTCLAMRGLLLASTCGGGSPRGVGDETSVALVVT